MIQKPRTLKSQRVSVNSLDEQVAMCIAELLAAAPAIHALHLSVTGPASYARHMALNEAYDALPDAVDTVAEGYQGAAEVLLNLPVVSVKKFMSVEDCVEFCRMKCQHMTEIQQLIPYSEVVNNIDLIKDILNTLKYKLIFLA